MKIAIIGFGAAAIGLIERIKDSDIEIHIFEKSKDIYSSSISGIRADGKLFVSKEMGGDLDIDLTLQKRLVDFWIEKTGNGEFEQGSSFANMDYYKMFYQKKLNECTLLIKLEQKLSKKKRELKKLLLVIFFMRSEYH